MKNPLPSFFKKVGGKFFLLCICFSSACNLIDPEEPTPAYLYIPEFRLQTNPATQGTDSHKITDIWLTVNGKFIGVYPLPATVPVLAEGQAEIIIEPGIKNNGINGASISYPLYRIYETAMDLAPGKTDTIRPLTSYISNLKVAAIDDFESGGRLFNKVLNDSGSGMVATSDDVFEGNFSGLITLDKDRSVVEISTTRLFQDLTATSPVVYLEVNYKAEAPVVFGVIGYVGGPGGLSTAILDPGFAPKDTWNKIYFNLSPLLTDPQYTGGYQLVLQAFIPQENGQFIVDSAKILMDNIKLLHL